MNAVTLHVTPGLDQVPRSFNQYTVRASCAAIGTSSGDVYIYHKEPGRPWDSTPRAILQAGSASELFFGAALALSSEELLVGVPGAHLALIFRRPMRDRTGFTRPWPREAAFRLDGHQDIVMLGQSVALSATHAAVGSHASAQVVAFERRGDGTWLNAGVVLHPVAETPFQSSLVLLGIRAPYLSEFGKAVSLSDSYLFVSDPGVRAVSIFHAADNFSESGRTVLRPQAIFGEDNDAIFGDCVSGTDLFLVVGATGSNRVFIFKSYQNLSWPAAPAQMLTYANPRLNLRPAVQVEILSARTGVQVLAVRQLARAPGKAWHQSVGLVAGFLRAHISQSSSQPSASNDLTVSLVSSVALHRPGVAARISIAGLLGSATYLPGTQASVESSITLLMRLHGGNATQTWTSPGTWSQAQGYTYIHTYTFFVCASCAVCEERVRAHLQVNAGYPLV